MPLSSISTFRTDGQIIVAAVPGNHKVFRLTGGADPHSLVEALATSELAVETAVTLRNKVVEAYQEILRMPV